MNFEIACLRLYTRRQISIFFEQTKYKSFLTQGKGGLNGAGGVAGTFLTW